MVFLVLALGILNVLVLLLDFEAARTWAAAAVGFWRGTRDPRELIKREGPVEAEGKNDSNLSVRPLYTPRNANARFDKPEHQWSRHETQTQGSTNLNIKWSHNEFVYLIIKWSRHEFVYLIIKWSRHEFA